jgi:flagellar hook-associated protein 3 FlgL
MTEEFRSFFGALNTEVSGRHVFSGTRTDTAPLAAFEDMIAELNSHCGRRHHGNGYR